MKNSLDWFGLLDFCIHVCLNRLDVVGLPFSTLPVGVGNYNIFPEQKRTCTTVVLRGTDLLL